MRTRVVLTAGGVASVALLATAAPAQAAPTKTGEECIKLLEEGNDVTRCQEAPNPIIPATNELFYGGLSFLILLALMWKFAFPAVQKGMRDRTQRIRDSLDDAERTKAEAQRILEDYQRQLADAKNESARIIEEARQSADKLRQDLKKQAEAEVAEIKARAQEDIAAQVERAMGDLRARVADMTIELTEKVVQRNLDRETNLALIERFIDEAGNAA